MRIAAAALFILCFTAPHARSAGDQLNLFIWSEYIDPAVVADFEKRFDCTVVVDLYEDEGAMMAKLQGGGVSLYDVVVPPDHKVPALVKLGLVAALRRENIPNLKNIDPKFLNPPYDPANRYSVAYQWGTVGIYARKPAGKELERTWGLLFDPKLQPGPFVLIDSGRDLIGAALKYSGHSLNSVNGPDLKQARDILVAAKRRSVGLDGSVGAKNKVLAKIATAAVVYSGEAVRGIAEDPETVYLIPREGSQIWVDNLVIPAKAPHRDLAEKFINFVLDPKIGARISNYTQFATPNKAALEFVRPEDRNNPAIYPPQDVMEKLEFLQDAGAKTRLFDEVWTQVKSRS